MKKKIRNNDLILKTIHKNKKCPVCKKNKEIVIHFLHKNILKQKRVLELLLCVDCINSTRENIIQNKQKEFFSMIPVLNSMLEAAGLSPNELSIDQIAELLNEDKKGENENQRVLS